MATEAEPSAVATATVDEGARLDPALEVQAPKVGSITVRREPSKPAAAPSAAPLGLLKPIAPIAEIIEQQNALRAFIKQALVEDRDYGSIPGIEKPSLLKPGAERINAAYGVIARFSIVEQEIDHDRENKWRKDRRIYERGTWTGKTETLEGVSYGLYRFVLLCELVHRETGIVVGSCIGSCSTLESKYIDRPRDTENTINKMAQKRAYVGATLLAYGLSDEFTQDVEDTGATAENGDAKDPNAPAKVAAPVCPVHNVPMKDFRTRKKSPKAPDWKCTQHTMTNGAKVWCEEVKWPGQWPPKSDAPANPQPAESKAATSSAEPAGPQSNGGTAKSESEPASTSPSAPIPNAANAPQSSSDSQPTGTSDSARSEPTNTITRGTVIEWATDRRLSVIQGKRLQDLKWEQLDYFVRNAHLLPGGWLEAIKKEITLRDETGDERDEKDDGGSMYGDGY